MGKLCRLTIVLAITVLLSVFCGAYSANTSYNGKEADYDKNGYGFVKNDDGYTFVDYTGTSKTVKIPSKFKGKKVTVIDLQAALDNSSDYDVIDMPRVKVSIPSTVTKILPYFYSDKVKEYKVSKSNKNFSSKNGVLYNKKQTKLLSYPTQRGDKEFTIPDSVEKIGRCAFQNSMSLKKLTFGKNVKVVDKEGIYQCTRLTKIKLNKKLKEIRAYGIFAASGLKVISIPKSVQKLGKYAVAAKHNSDSAVVYDRKNITIQCRKDSAAHKFAKKHKLIFELID